MQLLAPKRHLNSVKEAPIALPSEEAERIALLDDLLWGANCPSCGRGMLKFLGWNDLRGRSTSVQVLCEHCGGRKALEAAEFAESPVRLFG